MESQTKPKIDHLARLEGAYARRVAVVRARLDRRTAKLFAPTRVTRPPTVSVVLATLRRDPKQLNEVMARHLCRSQKSLRAELERIRAAYLSGNLKIQGNRFGNRDLTLAQRLRIRRLWESGLRREEIMRRCKVGSSSIDLTIRLFGLKRRLEPLSAEKRQAIRDALVDQGGRSPSGIALHFGVCERTVRYIAAEMRGGTVATLGVIPHRRDLPLLSGIIGDQRKAPRNPQKHAMQVLLSGKPVPLYPSERLAPNRRQRMPQRHVKLLSAKVA